MIASGWLVAAIVAHAVATSWNALETRLLRRQMQLPPAAHGDTPEICLHPSEFRTDCSTSGTWRWRCDQKKGGCGHVLEVAMVSQVSQ